VNTEIRVKREDRKSLAMVAGPDGLVVRLPCAMSPDDPQVQAFMETGLAKLDAARWYEAQAPTTDHDLRALVHTWAERIGVEVTRIYIRPMRRKWASCSSRGTLTLAADLVALPPELVEYVICHDLVHLRVPDHGKGFKAMMNAHMPDWKGRERGLAAYLGLLGG